MVSSPGLEITRRAEDRCAMERTATVFEPQPVPQPMPQPMPQPLLQPLLQPVPQPLLQQQVMSCDTHLSAL